MKKSSIPLLLVLVALPSWAQTFTCAMNLPAGFTCSAVGQPPPAPPPAVVQPPAPIPAPATIEGAACGAGEVMASGDRVWSPLNDVTLWPIPPVTGSGDSGRAIQFVADSVKYPRGVRLVLIDETPSGPNDHVISECPHRFAPVNGQASCMASGVGSYGGLYPRFGATQVALQSYDCLLTPGRTYYLNFRNYSTPRGTVSSQFVIYKRTD